MYLPKSLIKTAFALAFTCLCLAMPLAATAQKTKLKAANKLFSTMSYQKAIVSYLELLDKYDISQAKINLAECYRILGNKSETEYWLGQVVHLPDAKPIHKLYYGMALQSANKCDLAKQWFDEYARLEPNDIRAQYIAKSCESVVVLDLMSSSAEYYEVKSLPTPINSNANEISPTFYKNGIVFCSARDKGTAVVNIDAQTGEGFFDAYYVEVQQRSETNERSGYSKPVKMEKLSSTYHDGPMSFSADGLRVFITRTNMVGKDDAGVRRTKIYWADKLPNGNWSDFKGLPCNSDEFSNMHPSVTADGNTLYYVSDMKTGWGGTDIYYLRWEDGRWSAPNTIADVNTEGNEAYPFIHESGMLYFSSNGREKIGGMDVYCMQTGSKSDGKINNMGYPINTVGDDVGFTLSPDRTTGYFASDRNGGTTGFDLFSLKRLSVDLDVLVVDKASGKPIENATVMSECGTKKYTTDAAGRFATEMPVNKCCEFAANRTGFTSESKSVCTKGKTPGQLLRVRIELDSDRRKEVSLAGVIRDKKGNTIPNANVQLKNAQGATVQEIKTDDKGNYKFMVREDEKYDVVCDISQYLTAGASVDTRKATSNSTNTTPNIDLNLTVRKAEDAKKSMTFVMNNIYWDYGKANVREEAQPSIDKLYTFLKNNPTLTVEIGSHTDSRGSTKANQKLSQQRAQAVLEYIVSKGIDRARLTARGYGEDVLLNTCTDKVKCSEEEHQRNRRTEFRVTGTVDGQKFDGKSDAPERIQVDGCSNCSF